MTFYRLNLICCFYIKNTILKDLTDLEIHTFKQTRSCHLFNTWQHFKVLLFWITFQYEGFDPNLEMSFDVIFENVHACVFMKGRE